MAKGEKTGGRVKGTPNKKKSEEIEEIKNLFKENGGFTKIFEYIEQTASESPKDAASLMLKVAEFAYPKLKSIDLSATVEEPTKHRTSEEIQADLEELNGK